MDIAKIDPNFAVTNDVDLEDIIWLDAAQDPFVLYGAVSAAPYLRMPLEVAKTVSEGVYELARHTSGIRLRFRTDSPYIAIHCEWDQVFLLNNMTPQGIRGFDMYEVTDVDNKQHLVRPLFRTPVEAPHGYDSIVPVSGKMTDYVLNFPLYNEVKKLCIGVSKSARFETPATYANKLPVVFYGNSITQGGCASRSGNSYQNYLSRMMNMDYINLGFSGCGKAEDAMVEYLKTLSMSVLVCDYDHNAPSSEYLRNTHYKMYETIRKAQPDLPYIMVTRSDHHGRPIDFVNRQIIMESYIKARQNGDENVYIIDGSMFFAGENYDDHTVDGCHPNDLGFYRMAQGLYPVLYSLLHV